MNRRGFLMKVTQLAIGIAVAPAVAMLPAAKPDPCHEFQLTVAKIRAATEHYRKILTALEEMHRNDMTRAVCADVERAIVS